MMIDHALFSGTDLCACNWLKNNPVFSGFQAYIVFSVTLNFEQIPPHVILLNVYPVPRSAAAILRPRSCGRCCDQKSNSRFLEKMDFSEKFGKIPN